MALAIFDLDNTLLGGDSDHAWGEYLVETRRVDPVSHKKQNDAFYEDYLKGELDIVAYQRFALAPLVGQSPDILAAWHADFMASKIEPMILPAAEALIEKHRAGGDTLLIITATNDFVTTPIARHLGIEHLIATRAERTADGHYTGNIVGTPCYQEGKIERLNQWLDMHDADIRGATFYSDSHNDIPLLETVDNPVAVDPDETLRRHAERKQWPVISLRKG